MLIRGDWRLIKFAKRTDLMDTIESKQFLEFRRMSLEARDCISLVSLDRSIMTPKVAREAGKKAIDQGDTHYTQYYGDPALRSAIARKLREDNGIEADPESEIIVTNGAMGAIFATVQTFVESGDEVIMPNPTFVQKTQARLAGGTPVEITLREERDFRINPDEIERNVSPRTKLIALVSPNNPTASVLQKEDLENIAEIAVKHDLLVLSDEAYEKIVFDGNRHISIGSLPGMEDRTITISGFTKGYAMTGWRVGYLVADKKMAARIGKIAYHTTICANSIAQKAAAAVLTEPEAKREREEILEEYDRRRRLFVEGLNKIDGIGCKWPAGTYWIYVNVKSFGMPVVELALYLLEHGKVLVNPGTAFGSGGEGYMRVCMASKEENIKNGLRRMEEVLAKLR